MIIIIMGPQGSGKSTQAALLAKKLKLPHLQVGEVLRELAQQGTRLGLRAKSFWGRGRLVTEKLFRQILQEEIKKDRYRSGLVGDGVPRTLIQAKNLPFKVDKVIYLRVRDEENVKRLRLRKREDDTVGSITERLKLYHRETEPVLDFYRGQGILLEVDGERSIEAIYRDICSRFKINDSD